MTQTPTPDLTAPRRGFLLGAAAFSASAGATGIAAAAKPAEPAKLASVIQRARFSLSESYLIPKNKVNRLNVVRWNTVTLQNGIECHLQPDGMLLIRRSGLYRITLSCDWVAQAGTDVGLRMMGIRRRPVGGSAPSRGFPVDILDDRLASVDVPGSSAPPVARYAGEWSPAPVPPGGTVTTEVELWPSGAVNVGDVALVSHTGIVDAALGAEAVNALILRAFAVGPNKVRVCLFNPSRTEILVPPGALNVVGMNAVQTSGESEDAWGMLHTTTEELFEGDKIYAVVRSRTPGDYLQATKTCFLHIEQIV